MIPKLIELSDQSPDKATGKNKVVAILNSIYKLIITKQFQEEFLEKFVLDGNFLTILLKESKNPTVFVGMMTEILTGLNEMILKNAMLTDAEKDQITKWFIEAVEELPK